jgi:hypothetical protein
MADFELKEEGIEDDEEEIVVKREAAHNSKAHARVASEEADEDHSG